MKPYYEHGGITIYHGDAKSLLPYISGVDAVVTDPPYGISYSPDWKRRDGSGNSFSPIAGDDEPFNPSHLLGFEKLVIWGANNFSDHLPAGGCICWDKRCSEEAFKMFGRGFELAWKSSPGIRIVHLQHGGIINADGNNNNGKGRSLPRAHPTQKPVKLMEACILEIGGEVFCDPYCGSGTTLIAAKNLHKSAIGIEIEEKYCEIAAKRLSQEVFQF